MSYWLQWSHLVGLMGTAHLISIVATPCKFQNVLLMLAPQFHMIVLCCSYIAVESAFYLTQNEHLEHNERTTNDKIIEIYTYPVSARPLLTFQVAQFPPNDTPDRRGRKIIDAKKPKKMTCIICLKLQMRESARGSFQSCFIAGSTPMQNKIERCTIDDPLHCRGWFFDFFRGKKYKKKPRQKNVKK